MDCWHREIERSATEAQIVEGASDFLALWSPRELEPVTLGWRDLRIGSAEDVDRMKKWLVEDLDAAHSADPGARQLGELANYFWHASTRISELRAGSPSMR